MERLLLVENDPEIRSYLAKSLERKFEVVETDSVVEAIDLLEKSASFSAIVTDLNLIEGDKPSGLTVAFRARMKFPNAAIVLMSGANLSIMAEKMLLEITATFLQKPFRKQELFKILEDVAREMELQNK